MGAAKATLIIVSSLWVLNAIINSFKPTPQTPIIWIAIIQICLDQWVIYKQQLRFKEYLWTFTP